MLPTLFLRNDGVAQPQVSNSPQLVLHLYTTQYSVGQCKADTI